MKRLARILAATAIALLAAACGNNDGESVDPPTDFRVVAGDGSAIATWTAEPDVDYWIFFGPGANITTSNWSTSGGAAITAATSPRIITGLANGVTYSFTINGRKNRGPGGSGAPTQVVVPTLAGANWAVGPPLGNARLNSIASGTLFTGFTIATVGAGGAIFTSVNNGPMTSRTNATAPADLNAVWYGVAGFVAAGPNGLILQSLNGSEWVQQTSGTTATLYGGASSQGSNYIAVGAGGVILNSGNGQSWTSTTVGENDFYAATFGAARFVAVGAAGTIYASNDGSNWGSSQGVTDRALRGVAYAQLPTLPGTTTANNLYVAVGDAGTVITSTDAGTWTVVPAFTSANLRGITYGGRFVAVGDGGVIFTSADGLNWEAQASGTTNDLMSVARQLSGYTAVGAAGTNVSTF